mgnify:CR=1 FL=1
MTEVLFLSNLKPERLYDQLLSIGDVTAKDVMGSGTMAQYDHNYRISVPLESRALIVARWEILKSKFPSGVMRLISDSAGQVYAQLDNQIRPKQVKQLEIPTITPLRFI